MITSKWCNENLNSGNIHFSDVRSEIKEVLEAKTLSNLREEISDVIYFTYCWLYSKFKISLPMLGAMTSVDKFHGRLIVWEMIFTRHGLKFHRKYLVNGSNYEKESKVKLAIMLARQEQGETTNH